MSDSLLDRALNLLDAIAREAPCRFGELKKSSGINAVTLSKILQTLCRHEYLVRTEAGYRLGPRIGLLAASVRGEQSLVDLFRVHAPVLSESFQATVLLMAHHGEHSVVLDKVCHEAGPSMREIGSSRESEGFSPWDLHRLLLLKKAALPRITADYRRHFGKMRKKAPSVSAIRKAIKHCGAAAYADDFGLAYPPVRRIAVPIRREERVLGYLGLGVLDTGALNDAVRAMADAAVRCANQMAASYRGV
jgi:DNA-binding IclR family transcriptional regulator